MSNRPIYGTFQPTAADSAEHMYFAGIHRVFHRACVCMLGHKETSLNKFKTIETQNMIS